MPACAGADTGARLEARAPAMAAAEGSGDKDGAAIRRAVKRLSFGSSWQERAEAAAEVGRLARSDERTKRALPELGVVPPLLSMLAEGGEVAGAARMAAVRALLELARGTHRNKVHIVKAGLLKKLPEIMADRDLATSHDLALLLLSVSSLANTDFPLSSAELLPFLVATLGAAVPADTRLSCLAALRNLSANLEHVRAVATSGAVSALLALSSLETTTSEAALGVLADLVAASASARREMAEDEAAPRALVEAVARHDSAACQEHATYLVMALAHGSAGRELMRKMRRLGAVQAILEVSLLGSPLVKNRAAKILQWFKDDGRDRIRAHSGPRTEATPSCCGSDGDDAGDGQGTKACQSVVHRIVKQSLDRNMKSIMRRAAASVDMTTDATKQLGASSSSKILPC